MPVLASLLAITLFACAGRTIDDEASTKTVLDAALTATSMKDRGLIYLSETDNDFEMLDDDILSGKYGELLESPTVSMMKSYAVFYAFDNYGIEMGVFNMKTAADAKAMAEFINHRRTRMMENAAKYPDLDTSHISMLTVKTDGCWVYYIMSDNTDIAIKEMEKILYK